MTAKIELRFGRTPYGRRKVFCACNAKFDANDPDIECFTKGEYSEVCPACNRHPWYRISTERPSRARVSP